MRFEGEAISGHSVLLDVEAGMPVHQQQAHLRRWRLLLMHY